jgi:ferredoxin-NADP reductase
VGSICVDGREVFRDVLVVSTSIEANSVLSLRLVDPAGAAQPKWEPGAHLNVVLPPGRVNAKSSPAIREFEK